MSERVIYLDIDGCILPYSHKSDNDLVQVPGEDGMRPRSELQPGLERRWLSHDEFYYPEITKRLGEIAACIVLVSSRSFGILADPAYRDIVKDLGVDSLVCIDDFRPNKLEFKTEAVKNHWQGIVDEGIQKRGWEAGVGQSVAPPTPHSEGARAAWVEDLADPTDSTDDMRIIRPLATIGLTMAQVDEIETFFTRGEY